MEEDQEDPVVQEDVVLVDLFQEDLVALEDAALLVDHAVVEDVEVEDDLQCVVHLLL